MSVDVKPGTTIAEETVEGAGGVKIFIRSWLPEAKAKALVVLCHGLNAHSGYYGWAAEQLVGAGYAAYAPDLRGRGKSDGERFYVDTIDDYAGDVDLAVKLAQSRHPGLPVFLLGHSAGGVVSCIYVLDHPAELAGFICEDFAFQVPGPELALAVIKGLSHVAPHANVLKLHNENFSRDPEAVARMNADPLIANEVQPTQTIAALVRADERLKREFSRISLPVLILHGTEDKVTKPSGSQAFYDAAGSKDKTLKLYEGYYHDLLNDAGKETVMADILGWIAARLA
ncbi:MAG TPA: alpha/beta hydrolase [Candidatus Eisenbacteria bacterium]|nr:alpha/beta hydrolase [Candidatus Eisenbacteria bacterium]